ncbi:MAG: hypothetical protein K9M11_01510 [Candidatus Pacebacteria bacterium]|nr:hypothetical protein [Candidatus Paceibacterota bacterium]
MLEVEYAHVRRCLTTGCWVVSDSEHEEVFHEFATGIMTGVDFDGNTIPIRDLGEDTSGEAIGDLSAYTVKEFEADPKKSAFSFPEDVMYKAFVRYSSGRGCFMAKENITSIAYQVTSCDYLLLMPDGTAYCGWRQKPS